ncbi:MAG TPA: hypothetical protein VNV66_11595 [Pilimelia sp.]|nr:hypothetical protein [Pilimelia sp.]
MTADKIGRWVGRAVALTLIGVGTTLVASAPAHADFQWRQVGVHGDEGTGSARNQDFQWRQAAAGDQGANGARNQDFQWRQAAAGDQGTSGARTLDFQW